MEIQKLDDFVESCSKVLGVDLALLLESVPGSERPLILSSALQGKAFSPALKDAFSCAEIPERWGDFYVRKIKGGVLFYNGEVEEEKREGLERLILWGIGVSRKMGFDIPLAQNVLARMAFVDRLEQECQRSFRYNQFFSLLLFDFSRCDKSSETEPLISVLQKDFRSTDLVTQWNDDIFLLILTNTDREGSEGAIERIQDDMKRRFSELVFRSVTFPLQGKSTEELLKALGLEG